MKRYCSLFLFLFFLLLINNRTIGASSDCSCNSGHLRIAACSYNSSYSLSKQDQNKQSEFTLLLFRKGIEGKGPLLSYAANANSLIIKFCLADFAVSKSGWIRYILSFSYFLALTPQFLSSFSLHAPPIVC